MAVNLGQAAAAVQHIHSKVASHAVDVSELTNDEFYESEKERKKALEAIEQVQSIIRQSVEKSERAKKTPRKNTTDQFARLVSAVDEDPNLQFQNATQNNLKDVASTANAMSDSIGGIIDDFNSILSLGGIEQFSATLESVPAVGFIDGNIMYMAISLDANGNTVENWTLFDTLPPGHLSGSDTVCLFSFNGIFFCSMGTSVWQKKPKPAGDPTLVTAATDNWANMFEPGWQPLNSILPAGDSLALAPYNNVASDGTTTYSALIRLASDGSLSWASGEVGPSMNFQPLQPVSGSGPSFLDIAYWSGSVWGYDSNNMVYEIQPVLTSGGALTGYNLGQTIQSDRTIKDFTAVDTGIIVATDDGFLYKFTINPPASPDVGPITTWDRWVPVAGVTRLSAASPGVILNLRSLTTYLKSEYISTQTSLFPYINQIQGFCASHAIYLSDLLAAAQQWQAAPTLQQKQQIADTEGQVAVQHAQVMGYMLSTSLKAANQIVVDMTRQTSQIDASIADQIANIGIQIGSLKATLNSLEKDKKLLTGGLWASIAGVFVGLGLIIAGFFFPPVAPFLWVGGGLLVIGSVVAVGVVSSQLAKCEAAIAATQSAITSLTTSKDLLTTIASKFTDITDDYGTLDAFWTTMLSVSGSINSLENLGTFLLADQPSIKAAQGFNQEIIDALKLYVAILGSQGIIPPDVAPRKTQASAQLVQQEVPALIDYANATQRSKEDRKVSQLNLVTDLVQTATHQLSQKDRKGYYETMKKAAVLNAAAHNLIYF